MGYSSGGAEKLDKKIPAARVLMAFNAVFAQHKKSAKLGDGSLTAFVAGDNAHARAFVPELAREIGFDAVDAGSLSNARLLGPVA